MKGLMFIRIEHYWN